MPSTPVSTPQVSVILPTYNRAGFLGEAMKSVLSQSFGDLELIVVDDASTEDVESAALSLGDPRVRYLRRARNGGAGAARNTGVEAARGAMIAFHDSDDLWLPGKLAAQVAQLSAAPPDVGLVFGGKIVYGRDAGFVYGPGRVAYAPPPAGKLEPDEDQLRRALLNNRISLQNALFRRDVFGADPWFDDIVRANVDWEFAVRLMQRTRAIEVLEPVVVGFVSNDSISRSQRRKIIANARVLKKNCTVYDRYPREKALCMWRFGALLKSVGHGKTGLRFMMRALFMHPVMVGHAFKHFRSKFF